MEALTMQTQTHLYEQVAGKIERLIEDGVLRPGERVPSVRKVSQMHRVSMATAFQAYFLLENKGLIESRPRSGFYVRMLSKGLPPTPNRTSPAAVATSVNVDDLVGSILAAMRRPDLVQLGAASPSSDLLPVNRLNRTLMDVVRRSPKRTIEYELIAGNAELRRQIALRSLTWGGNLSADDIVVTNGCIEALNLCLRAVARAGDTIAIESPTYYGVLQVIENLGMRALEIPTSPTDGICLDALETALHSQSIAACLVMSNFNNPLGSCMPDAKKQRLVKILAGHVVPLIEDDIYGDLNFGTTRPKTCKAFDRDGLVLLCASFSKTLAPGYRIGWTAPGRFRAQVERLKGMNTIATATLPQMVVAEFLKNGGYERYLRQLRLHFASHLYAAKQAIFQSFPPGTKVTRPGGGFVLWVEFPEGIDTLELHYRALEHKISLAPGVMFSPSKKYQNCVRLSFGQKWSETTQRAIETVGKLASQGT